MGNDLIARASTTIKATDAAVWDALTNPDAIKRYMFGATVTTSWREGSPIYWKGEWQGKPYEDKGVVLYFKRPRHLEFSHYSPLSGQPDVPASYHTVSIKLSADGDGTRVSLTQDNNPSEEARDHSQKNWEMMLSGLKKVVEEQVRVSPA